MAIPMHAADTPAVCPLGASPPFCQRSETQKKYTMTQLASMQAQAELQHHQYGKRTVDSISVAESGVDEFVSYTIGLGLN